MSNPIVLAFHPDGEIEYTRNSQFTPFDGRGDMVRVTDIQKLPDRDMYFVQWLKGPHTGEKSGLDIHAKYLGKVKPCKPCHISARIFVFNSYEDAVAYEVQLLNAMRRQGISFK